VQQINLYHPPAAKSFDLLDARGISLLLLLVMGSMGALLGYVQWDLAKKQHQLNPLMGQLEQITNQLTEVSGSLTVGRPDPALQQSLKQLSAELEHKPRILASLKGEGGGNLSGFSDYLTGLARQRPDGIWLTAFSLTQGGRHLDINGAAEEPGLAPAYLQRLAEEPRFSETSFNLFRLYRDEEDSGPLRFRFGNGPAPDLAQAE